ncbi:hypothetical protein GCM10009804_46440 [Kribbella hippodromi]|uniref:Uncharacterized protein n=1 Tax=Kribbella hippodromi TaxID=434347 RepID=A0ABN2DTM5_9ACTN
MQSESAAEGGQERASRQVLVRAAVDAFEQVDEDMFPVFRADLRSVRPVE